MATWSWRPRRARCVVRVKVKFRGYHPLGNEDVLDAGSLGLVRVRVRG